jgi:hypothetical protein
LCASACIANTNKAQPAFETRFVISRSIFAVTGHFLLRNLSFLIKEIGFVFLSGDGSLDDSLHLDCVLRLGTCS